MNYRIGRANGISVLDTGAKGDGVTLDHVAIQAALHLAAGRFPVLIPDTGFPFLLGEELTIPNGTELIVDGTLKLNDGANCNIFNLQSSVGVHIHGRGTLDGNGLNQNGSASGQGGIVCGNTFNYTGPGAANFVIEGITIQNMQYWPWNLVASSSFRLDGVTAQNCGNSANVAQAHDFVIRDCFVSGTTSDMGLVVYGSCYNGIIEGCTSSGNHAEGINVYDDQYSSGACHDLLILNNLCYINGESGIGINSGSNPKSVHYNIKIVGNITHGNLSAGTSGVCAVGCNAYCKYVEIADNLIYDEGNAAGTFGVLAYGEHIKVAGNLIYDIGQGGTAGRGIGLGATATTGGPYHVLNNSVEDDQAAPTTVYALELSGPVDTVYKGVVLAGNRFTTNLAAGGAPIYNPGGWTFASRNNVGYNPVGNIAAPAMPGSGTALVNPEPYTCRVFISGGTVTAIAIGGISTGLTSGSFDLEPGESITLTYSAAPSWSWFGK